MPGEPCILLTGGGGFVGRYLAPALAKRFPAHRRVILCLEDSAGLPLGWQREVADITDEAAAGKAISQHKPSIVVHLAAQSSAGQSAHAAEATWRVNFGGSFALACAVARHAPDGVFLFASSSEVYGANFLRGPVTEETPPAPLNAYASSKLAAELMLRDVLPPSTKLIIARAFNHTGPGQDERFVLPSFAAQIARIEAGLCEPRLRVGNLSAERDFMHVADVAEAYVRLLERADGLPRHSVFNVTSGQTYKLEDLLGTLRGLARKPFEIEHDPERMRASDIPCAKGDPALLKDATGWAPLLQVEELLQELLEWWRGQVKAER
jgi:GDP-4-dehydro-6-deoxy-D-mannose reductase